MLSKNKYLLIRYGAIIIMNKIGKFEREKLRDIWNNEEYDFSVWLSKKKI